jgi:hypothetical protein
MSEPYFPFDLGSWASTSGRQCPKHGLQQGGLAISVTPHRGAPAVIRNYCGLCVIEALDAVLPQLEP